jgi:hypothetical protein
VTHCLALQPILLGAPVVRADLLERRVDVAPADAAATEDLVEPLDDEGSFDRGQLETTAGIGAQRLGWEWGLDRLHLILGQHGTPPIWYVGPPRGGGTETGRRPVKRERAR